MKKGVMLCRPWVWIEQSLSRLLPARVLSRWRACFFVEKIQNCAGLWLGTDGKLPLCRTATASIACLVHSRFMPPKHQFKTDTNQICGRNSTVSTICCALSRHKILSRGVPNYLHIHLRLNLAIQGFQPTSTHISWMEMPNTLRAGKLQLSSCPKDSSKYKPCLGVMVACPLSDTPS